ncbi:hypothetical protein LCGC14_3023750 [marine sediment metagenome]|uniref:Uncharacterized protein n=1 Tax=marine sediment metagenome TaxID=412755 RepID=A0A0F8Z262_9ZZZZ
MDLLRHTNAARTRHDRDTINVRRTFVGFIIARRHFTQLSLRRRFLRCFFGIINGRPASSGPGPRASHQPPPGALGSAARSRRVPSLATNPRAPRRAEETTRKSKTNERHSPLRRYRRLNTYASPQPQERRLCRARCTRTSFFLRSLETCDPRLYTALRPSMASHPRGQAGASAENPTSCRNHRRQTLRLAA